MLSNNMAYKLPRWDGRTISNLQPEYVEFGTPGYFAFFWSITDGAIEPRCELGLRHGSCPQPARADRPACQLKWLEYTDPVAGECKLLEVATWNAGDEGSFIQIVQRTYGETIKSREVRLSTQGVEAYYPAEPSTVGPETPLFFDDTQRTIGNPYYSWALHDLAEIAGEVVPLCRNKGLAPLPSGLAQLSLQAV